jgi:hypothetical protein
VEGNGRDLILLRHLHGMTEKNDVSSVTIDGVSVEIRNETLQNTSTERYRYTNLRGLRY